MDGIKKILIFKYDNILNKIYFMLEMYIEKFIKEMICCLRFFLK